MNKKPKILYFDIETTPLKAYIWRLGEQRVGHNQLMSDGFMYDVICITYCWNDGKPAKALDWGYNAQDSAPMFKKFDELIKRADVVIGKNSDRFDNKHINIHRLLNGNPGMPDWTRYTDDLEKQMRKHFALPSYSLDYFSKLLGIGGKIKMEFQDWIDIVEKKSRASFNKMINYGKKDIEDTRKLWEYCERHFRLKHNIAAVLGERGCVTCGSQNLQKNGTRVSGGTTYQTYACKDHAGYAGKVPLSKPNSDLRF